MPTQYGKQVKTISDFVRTFSLKQGNTKAAYFVRNLEFAAWAWKEMFRKSIWEIKTVVLTLDKDHNIRIPDDCERMVNVSVVDRFGKLQPLSYNPNMSTVEVMCETNSCACTHCHGKDTLCAAVENISVVFEDIIIDGETYQKVTYIKADGCGNIIKEEHVPVTEAISEKVVTTIVTTSLCKVEVSDKGCILPTAPNINMLQTYCGYNGSMLNNGYRGNGLGYNAYRSLIPVPYNYYGHWNWNAACQDIIHIFRSAANNCTYINQQDTCTVNCAQEQNDIHKVILSYQTIGAEPGVEILIPEYAEMAISIGILYQQALFNPKDMDRNNAMLYKFRAAKKDVDRHLNPIRMDDIIKIQTQPHLW